GYKTTMWLDSDLTSKEPKLVEVFKIPEAMVSVLPPEIQGKEYLVMDFNEVLKQSQPTSEIVDFSKLSELSTGLQQQTIEFIKKYFEKFDPGFNYLQDVGQKKLTTPNGDVNVHVYKVKLSDKTFKDYIRYIVNDFATSKEMHQFFMDYLKTIETISPETEEEKKQSLEEIEKIFKEMESNPQEMAEFNKVMDELNKIQILGDNGIEIEYGIDNNGYIISQSGVIDIKLNLSDLSKVDSTINETGTINFVVKFDGITYDINKNIEVIFPKLTEENSINLMDLMAQQPGDEDYLPMDRLSGEDRFETSVAISSIGWTDETENVVLAYGNDFPDALCASTLAKSLDAPILLVSKDSLSEKVKKEIERLNPSNVYIVGGPNVISENIEKQVKAVVSNAAIKRISGNNRYETSVKTAQNINSSGKVVLAYGEDYADALSVAPFAAKMGMPILLVNKSSMDSSVKSYLKNNDINTVYIVGGVNVISDDVKKQVSELVPSANIERIFGDNRFATNREIIKKFATDDDYYHAYLAIGEGKGKFADALSGSALIAKYDGVLVLVNNTVNKETVDLIKEKTNGAIYITVLGGEKVVPNSIVESMFE
ncbi:MAG: cell wall-binding repeat-containing protein, partial [Clostridiales bacterium]|nr:cell wall-binding repeat-containing protein [Clostridiales bacterium]